MEMHNKLMAGPTRPMTRIRMLITCINAGKSTTFCHVNALRDEQTRQLESNLVRPFIHNFGVGTLLAAGLSVLQ